MGCRQRKIKNVRSKAAEEEEEEDENKKEEEEEEVVVARAAGPRGSSYSLHERPATSVPRQSGHVSERRISKICWFCTRMCGEIRVIWNEPIKLDSQGSSSTRASPSSICE